MEDNRELALQFVRAFASADLSALQKLLTPDLRFRGPLLQTDRAETYLAALNDGSMEPAEARILHVGIAADSVSVFYEYIKLTGTVTIAQLFRFRGGRISELLVVFNARGFA